jgi:hypothetical protein
VQVDTALGALTQTHCSPKSCNEAVARLFSHNQLLSMQLLISAVIIGFAAGNRKPTRLRVAERSRSEEFLLRSRAPIPAINQQLLRRNGKHNQADFCAASAA